MDEVIRRVDSHIASLTYSQDDQLVAERKDAELDAVTGRLEACNSFGFEGGTEAHAECATKLYMNEQNQGASKANSKHTNVLKRSAISCDSPTASYSRSHSATTRAHPQMRGESSDDAVWY